MEPSRYTSAFSWASVFVALHTVDDPHAWVRHYGPLDTLPDLPHRRHERLRGVLGVEVQADAHEVRIIDRPEDAIAADAGGLPPGRVAIKGRFPRVEVADGMLDLDCSHLALIGESNFRELSDR